jgi:hypothetical protein
MNRLDGEIALISGAARDRRRNRRRTVEARARVIVGDILDERAPETAREIGGGDTAATDYQRRKLETRDRRCGRAIGRARYSGQQRRSVSRRGIEQASLPIGIASLAQASARLRLARFVTGSNRRTAPDRGGD